MSDEQTQPRSIDEFVAEQRRIVQRVITEQLAQAAEREHLYGEHYVNLSGIDAGVATGIKWLARELGLLDADERR